MGKSLTEFIETGLQHDFLMITCGLPATGKTTAATIVAGVKSYPLLRSDLIRQEMFGRGAVFTDAVASDMVGRMRVYEELFQRAEAALGESTGVVLDATFLRQALRERAAAIAAGHGLGFIILETRCPPAVALRRIRGRTREQYESNAITEAAYYSNQRLFEAVDTDSLKGDFPGLYIRHLVIDAGSDVTEGWFVITETGDTD